MKLMLMAMLWLDQPMPYHSMGNEKPPVVAKAPQRRCEIPSEEVLTDLAKEIESKSGSKSEKPLLFREKRVYRRKDDAHYFSRK